MTEAIVLTPLDAHRQALALSDALRRAGVEADAPDLRAQWNDTGWRSIIAAWPEDAFVVFCLVPGAAEDSLFIKLLWHVVPMGEDATGRFVFAQFDARAAANENIAPFLKRHFTVDGADAAAIAAHVKSHRQALVEAVKAHEARRKAMEGAVLRQPPPAPPPGGAAGAGAPGVRSAEARQPMGVGSGGESIEERLARLDEAGRVERFQKKPLGSAGGSRADERPQPQTGRASSIPASAPPVQSAPMPSVRRAPAAPPKLDKVDAMAFAPKKLRRGTSELIRVAIFRPRDRARAAKAAKRADARARGAGSVEALGKIERGARISAVLDVRGAECDVTRIDAEWAGAPLDFNFPIEPSLDPAVAQAFVTVRILADDAQIGAITFVRPLIAAGKMAGSAKLDKEKLRRVERVFLSYSSDDRAPAAMIASAYQRAGIQCFFDRTGLKSGEEWSPRLLTEIGRADLFHLCWSRRAAASQWVERETSYAMTKRRKSGSKRPDITIQMLDGPPWAPHPHSLDALNFDDFLRAAVVGYARGDAS